jgi:GntR family transcriptional regulator, transcriptional repressor for pyruvate dehydrogenase complex
VAKKRKNLSTVGRKTLTEKRRQPGKALPSPRSQGPARPTFAPIRTKRVFEEICEQVRREMAAGLLRPGDKLPPERDLAAQLGVSRTAVREALRTLEIAGVVGMQKGATGGAFILKGDPNLVTRSIRDMFYLGRISLDDLTEARVKVMQIAMELASERIRPTTIAALEHNIERLAALPSSGPAARRVAISEEFYRLISQATDNTALQVVIQALTEIVLQQVEQSGIGTFPNLVAHRRRLVDLLAHHKAEEAKREITGHLRRLHRHLRRDDRTGSPTDAARTPATTNAG